MPRRLVCLSAVSQQYVYISQIVSYRRILMTLRIALINILILDFLARVCIIIKIIHVIINMSSFQRSYKHAARNYKYIQNRPKETSVIIVRVLQFLNILYTFI